MRKGIFEYLHSTVKTFGEKIAFEDTNSQVTFEQVSFISATIATELIHRNLFECPILVMMSRTVLTPVCHIGVARSGCFYVPMDATNPLLRLNQIIDISKADVMIVDRENYNLAKSLVFDGEILVLEELILNNADIELVSNAERKITDSMPLYVIFTSGSTGVPKGVTTSHHAVMSYIDAVTDVMGITFKDKLGNQSPMDYIAAVRDIYIPLKTGATTHIISNTEFAIPEALLKTLNNYGITTICWSAAGLELCTKIGLFECGIPKTIDKIIFSGSPLSPNTLMQWQRALPTALFVNQYGPTEATASCTYYIVSEKATKETVLPIGKPFENYKVFLLDENNRKITDDKIGEICVSGPAIALGYYNNAEATSNVFIQNPIQNRYREIIYKTGDLGRFNNEGDLMYCGRKDRQIKHMGHRIEIEEIELFGKKLESIKECVAIYDTKKCVLLFIYVGSITSKQVSLHFRGGLPSYMVPRKIIQVDEIPKLPNGKNDVKQIEKEYLL